MDHVSGHDVSAGAHRKRIAAGDTGSHPGFFWQFLEKAERAQTDLTKFFDMTGPGKVISPAAFNCNLLVKAGQRAIKPAGKPQCAKDKDALSNVHVVPRLAYAPFIRRITVERFFFRDSAQEG